MGHDAEVVLAGLASCDTCRKALRQLRESGRAARLRDLRSDPPDMAEARGWIARLGPAVLNTRSATWRGLDEEDRAGDPATLLVRYPALVKRPLVEMPDGALLLGWTPETRAALDFG